MGDSEAGHIGWWRRPHACLRAGRAVRRHQRLRRDQPVRAGPVPPSDHRQAGRRGGRRSGPPGHGEGDGRAVEEAFTDAAFVFSAIRVGGDQGRVIDEEVRAAPRAGRPGDDRAGWRRHGPADHPGGPFLLRSPRPVLAASRAHQLHQPGRGSSPRRSPCTAGSRAVGVCDTPSGTLARLGAFLGAEPEAVSFSYSGLNHLGWISSFSVEGEERIGELIGALRGATALRPPLRRLRCRRRSPRSGPCPPSTSSTTTTPTATSRAWLGPAPAGARTSCG